MLTTETIQPTKTRGRAQGRRRMQALDAVTPWKLRLGDSKAGGSTRSPASLRAALSAAPAAFVRDQEQPDGE